MKKLSFTQEDMSIIFEEFKKSLLNFKSNQEKFIYEKKFSEMTKIDETKIRKPVIYFAMEAWLKMLMLVKNCDKEIAWQATVEKRKYKNKEDSEDFFYYIKQVFVYPQKVTGTFVDVNEVKYTEWSLKLDDEVYNTLRFQGHSHVNMSVSPSGTDLNTYQNFLDQLGKDDFYIFMIMNKRQEFNIMVYDYAQDILFEHKDCHVDILIPQGSLLKWTEESMHNVEYKAEHKTYDRWGTENYYRGYYGYTPQPQYQAVAKQSSEITHANISGYLQDGTWHRFEDIDEAVLWFIDHPEAQEIANLTKEHRDLIEAMTAEKEMLERETPNNKKRGRPPKGSKK